MRLLLLSDMHLLWENPVCRLDNLVEEQFNKLRFVLDYASENELPIIQAGDFFDRPRSWFLLPKVIDLLKEYPNVEISTIYGQHDTYMYSEETRENTNLGILEKAGLVKIRSSLDFKGFKVMVVHAPISDEPLYMGPDNECIDAAKFLKKNKEFDLILCGDIHRQFCIVDKKDRFIINTGPMLRKTADEYNFKHKPSFCVFNTYRRKVNWVEIPHKSADEVISKEHINRKEEIDLLLDDFIDSIKNDYKATTVDLTENIKRFIKENEIDCGTINILSEVMNRRGE